MYSTLCTPLFGFLGLSTQEIMLLLVLGVLLFGRWRRHRETWPAAVSC